ncbi:hypothetical protein PSEUBRA_001882 [Kalmanozyma brasiliensis GHG001]|uniref:uncharacterized protein n=1 Tax=Kalmanozyma brasiliensis (strain GHG001) TaxID=1365824 RepID=UPI0028682496|nr:uncharacterized protein PSEUBRA_001882 [Kalmanozyma brasiliensis GHG001]KAF6767010.1 hypothetical protein PSEUBRA_001882 [Kalmanozyma brasiliensis GHG001]
MYPTVAQPAKKSRSNSSQTIAADSDEDTICACTVIHLVKTQEKLVQIQQEQLQAQKQILKSLAKLAQKLDEINGVLRLNTLRDVSDLQTMPPLKAKKFIEVLGDLPHSTVALGNLENAIEMAIAAEVKKPRSVLDEVLGFS